MLQNIFNSTVHNITMNDLIWLKDPTEHEIFNKPGKITEERQDGQKRIQKVCREKGPENKSR